MRSVPALLAGCLLAITLGFLADFAEARPKKTSVAGKHARKAHGKSAKSAKPVRIKRALSFSAPQTLVAEAQPLEAGESGLHGVASFYGRGFQGRKSASGERFDAGKMTAASNRFALGTWLAVRRLDSGLCVVVRVNDRMHPKHRVRIIDLSRGAAERLKMISAGLVLVRVVPLAGPPGGGEEEACQAAFAPRPAPEPEQAETLALPESIGHEMPLSEAAAQEGEVTPEAPREPFLP